MGFFKGLKEDIVQSVNELSDSLGDVLEEDETVTTIENPEQAQEELTEENVEEETIEETAIQDSAVEEKVNDEILEDSSGVASRIFFTVISTITIPFFSY